MRAPEHDIEIVGIYDPKHAREHFLDWEVVATIDACEPYDVCLLTDLNDPQKAYVSLMEQISMPRVMVLDILGVTTKIKDVSRVS